jgi:spore maturation protein CgeB
MRVLIVDAYYPAFLTSFYAGTPAAARMPYRAQRGALLGRCFGTADFYSRNLARLGIEAEEIIANAKPLQAAWAGEHDLAFRRRLLIRRGPAGLPVPWLAADWFYPVLRAQIEEYRPDVIHFQDPPAIDARFVREVRTSVRRVTAQIASAYPRETDFGVYDLVLSSIPSFVETFRAAGCRSELFHLGFEPAVLPRIPPASESGDVVFVGGIPKTHRRRIAFLEAVARRRPLSWWGYGIDALPRRSPLRACHRGNAWGLDMYARLRDARIALNHHDVDARYANNMRLYEATGVGALLLTDWKANLPDLFEPEREVAVYRTAEECVERIEHYLSHEDERAAVARAGQARTLDRHTYERRMEEYSGLVRGLL